MIGDQRSQGRRLILSQIRRAGRVARVDLARETGISQATVTAITAELLREGLIREAPAAQDSQDARRGRPRVDLQLRGPAHFVAGVKLAQETVSVVIMDFAGSVLGEHVAPLPDTAFAAADLAGHLAQAVSAGAKAAGMDRAALSGVGLGIAGFVKAPEGLVHWSPSLSARSVALREIASDRIGLPVFVDNDANLVAMAELYFGRGRDARTFVVVTIESGVGAGIVLDGALYRGTRGAGAEFGHIKVQLDGALCRCGQRGCLEAYCADYALLREATIRFDPRDLPDTTARIERLMAAAAAGDPMAQTIIDRAGRMFAMGLANLVNIFDPELIILAGERMQHHFLYGDAVREGLRRQIVQIDVPPPEIVIHRWGDMMWAKGAAAYALEGVAEAALQRLGDNAA